MLALPLGFFGGAAGGVIAVLCWASGLGVQDASLRAGIAQVVSMNKRGTAFGTFNGVYGVAWFLGSAAMGWLYGISIIALVTFGVMQSTDCGGDVLLAAAAARGSEPRRPLIGPSRRRDQFFR